MSDSLFLDPQTLECALEGTALRYDYEDIPFMTYPLLAQAFLLAVDSFHKDEKDEVMLTVYTQRTHKEDGVRFHINEYNGKKTEYFQPVELNSNRRAFYHLIKLFGNEIMVETKRNLYLEIKCPVTPRSAHSHFARQSLLKDVERYMANVTREIS